jgi:hypothetical protein
MLGQRRADRDERRGLGQPVDLGDLPAVLAFQPLDGGRGRWRPSRDDLDAGRHLAAHLGWSVGQRDQHGGGGTQGAHLLRTDQLEHCGRINFAQADVRGRGGGHGPGVGPAVGVEHRQRPQVPLPDPERQVQQGADGVHGRVPVGDHHTLGPGGGPAGVVDREQVPLADLRAAEIGLRRRDGRRVVQPAVPGRLEGHEVPYVGQPAADLVHLVEVVPVYAQHAGPGVVDDVAEVLAGQPVVQRHQHGAQLRYRVERGQLGVRVRGDRGHPVTGPDAEALQRRRPPVAAVEELFVAEPQVAVQHGQPAAVQPPGAAGEIEGGQRRFHKAPPR